jgi:dipeptidyl aminopeptidase/acylaminoacyl peptidase
MPYLEPAPDIVAIIDAPPTPAATLSPDERWLLLVQYESHPPIELLSRRMVRLGGVRVDPARRSRQRTMRLVGLTIVEVATGEHRAVELSDGVNIGFPHWSPDSRRFVFTVDDDDRVRVWLGDAASARAAEIPGLVVTDVLTGGHQGGDGPVRWSRDSRSLLALTVPADRVGAPPPTGAAPEPKIEETAGKQTQMATFQDLLASEADADQFEEVSTAQLVRVDVESLSMAAVGGPGMVRSFEESPDGAHVLVESVERPFSYRVPYPYFTRRAEVRSAASGENELVLGPLPIADEVPRQGVPLGPRHIGWSENRPASLLWVEALDGGDPMTKAEHRDRVQRADAPFTMSEGVEALRTPQRCLGWYELDGSDDAMVVEHDRDRRWLTTSLWWFGGERVSPERVLFDRSMNDSYGDPGMPVHRRHADGRMTVLQDGSAIFLRGAGATPEGNRPFVDRYDLTTGATSRLHASATAALEPVVAVLDGGSSVLVRRESPTEPPNFVVVDLTSGSRRALTAFPDPHPQLTGMRKSIRTHHRPDGVALSGVLHLPPGHDVEKDGRLPLLVWAYPLDYGDAATAGQVRGSDQGFTRLASTSPIWFVLRGFAVLADATMPVIGDPETMNDSYVEQVCAAALAHIDALDEEGIIDRDRVVVAGHSYGGFMTANLLAHTDLFAAGIARSGAYNRTLTPFGFQTERRSFWEAPSVYDSVSPFRHADQITAPLLLIHGAADNNPGTFTVQSERLFQALQGTGGTARLVLLPHEAHVYRARESVLHVLAEQFAWVDRWVKPSAGHAASRVVGSSVEPED